MQAFTDLCMALDEAWSAAGYNRPLIDKVINSMQASKVDFAACDGIQIPDVNFLLCVKEISSPRQQETLSSPFQIDVLATVVKVKLPVAFWESDGLLNWAL